MTEPTAFVNPLAEEIVEQRSQMENLLVNSPQLIDAFKPKWTPYIPHDPTGKQLAFCMLDTYREVGYGGAAGGGKSDALLMAALQYVDVPGYAALILRKTFADLSMPGALISRSHEWLTGTDAKWASQRHAWLFPSGAVLQFGYLDTELHKFRYQSTEFQFIGFDELTQFYEDDYRYLFSRLRKPRCPFHPANEWHKHAKKCKTCARTGPLSVVPLRLRSATNPGGLGHTWVKERFAIEMIAGRPVGTDPKVPFIPAFLFDNPFLDSQAYSESLAELDPVTREQLLRGDWAVTADGRFKKSWIKYFSVRGDYIILGRDGNGPVYHKSACRCFVTIDPAASVREGPGDAAIYRRAPSWTVISVFLLTPDAHLLWVDVKRFRKEIPDIFPEMHKVSKQYRPEFMAVEVNGLGIGVYQMALRQGLPLRSISPRSQDKIVRATDLMVRMESGRVWVPQQAAWLSDWETELFTWTGHPHEAADQIDTGAYAAMIVSEFFASDRPFTDNDLPGVY